MILFRVFGDLFANLEVVYQALWSVFMVLQNESELTYVEFSVIISYD